MRRLAAGVTLLTASDGTGLHGMAATAVVSVSVDPPSLLASINRDASIHRVIEATSRFCANILANEQAGIVGAYSTSSLRHRRFTESGWRTGIDGLPYLEGALAAVFCAVDHRIEYGTHSLFIGRVRSVVLGAKRPPLLWFDGSTVDLLCHASR